MKAASVPGRSQRRVRQQKAAGQERVWRMAIEKEKAVRLLQQSDGAPRFGKHGLQLCLVQGVSESRQRAKQRVFSR